MTIIKKEKEEDGVMLYIVKKDLTEQEELEINGKMCNSFNDIINHDADVFTEDGNLLLRFRKCVLPQENIDDFYDNVIHFAEKNPSRMRGAESGSVIKNMNNNKPIKSNIYGYFDTWTIYQKYMFKTLQIKLPPTRLTRFTKDYPNKWQKMIPLIKNIDTLYKNLVPNLYETQKKCADETAFRIADTAFSTITTNLNTQMACHRDSNNLKNSFGNLVVIEKGKYDGGYTGFPAYNIAVDVRTGDFLAMDVFQLHCNTPIILNTPDAVRLSIVCYLRQGVWEKSKGTTQTDAKQIEILTNEILDKYRRIKNENIHI